MNIDRLSLLEALEHAAERVESLVRRHRTRLLCLLAVAAAAAAVRSGPPLDARGEGPSARVAPSPRTASPTGAPSTSPRSRPPVRPATSATPAPPVVVAAQPGPAYLYVHVAGAVMRPGVVRLPVGARAWEAARAAGGLREDADLDRVNLAIRLRDEAMLVVPRRAAAAAARTLSNDGETAGTLTGDGRQPAPPSPFHDAAAADGEPPAGPDADVNLPATPAPAERAPVRLNQASAAQLELLPGIGPALARAIVAWRARHGPFTRIEDLQQVPRFGPRLLARLRRHLTL